MRIPIRLFVVATTVMFCSTLPIGPVSPVASVLAKEIVPPLCPSCPPPPGGFTPPTLDVGITDHLVTMRTTQGQGTIGLEGGSSGGKGIGDPSGDSWITPGGKAETPPSNCTIGRGSFSAPRLTSGENNPNPDAVWIEGTQSSALGDKRSDFVQQIMKRIKKMTIYPKVIGDIDYATQINPFSFAWKSLSDARDEDVPPDVIAAVIMFGNYGSSTTTDMRYFTDRSNSLIASPGIYTTPTPNGTGYSGGAGSKAGTISPGPGSLSGGRALHLSPSDATYETFNGSVTKGDWDAALGDGTGAKMQGIILGVISKQIGIPGLEKETLLPYLIAGLGYDTAELLGTTAQGGDPILTSDRSIVNLPIPDITYTENVLYHDRTHRSVSQWKVCDEWLDIPADLGSNTVTTTWTDVEGYSHTITDPGRPPSPARRECVKSHMEPIDAPPSWFENDPWTAPVPQGNITNDLRGKITPTRILKCPMDTPRYDTVGGKDTCEYIDPDPKAIIPISFDLGWPNRPRVFNTTWDAPAPGIMVSGGHGELQKALTAYITEQLAVKPGVWYILPMFAGPVFAGSSGLNLWGTPCPGDAIKIGGIIEFPPPEGGGSEGCTIGEISTGEKYKEWYANDGADGCSMIWVSYIVPIPPLNKAILGRITDLMYPVGLEPTTAEPSVGQVVKMSMTDKLGPAMFNKDWVDAEWPTLMIHANLIQAGVTISVGTDLNRMKQLKIIGDANGAPFDSGLIVIPRDPKDTKGGGYGDVQFTFLRTPLSVLQDPLCKDAADACGVKVVKDKVTGRYLVVFDLHIRTWWNGMYHANYGGMRGIFNPYWADFTPDGCSHIQLWTKDVANWGFSTAPWGRVAGEALYKDPNATEDWSEDINPLLFSVAKYGDDTPPGDAYHGANAQTCSGMSDFNTLTRSGSPLYWSDDVETSIPVVQVQAGGK